MARPPGAEPRDRPIRHSQRLPRPRLQPAGLRAGVPAGSTFIDQGHDLHIVRNNATIDAGAVYVLSFVPAGFPRRIDEPNPNPSTCPN